MKEKITVINSPWPNVLPNGTEVVRVQAPKKTLHGRKGKKVYATNWFKRADGVKILDRKDGKFRLFNDEINTEETN